MRRTCLPGAATPSTAIFPRAILRWCWFLVPHLWGGLCEPRSAGSLCQTAESHFGRAVPPRLDSRQDAREGVRLLVQCLPQFDEHRSEFLVLLCSKKLCGQLANFIFHSTHGATLHQDDAVARR